MPSERLALNLPTCSGLFLPHQVRFWRLNFSLNAMGQGNIETVREHLIHHESINTDVKKFRLLPSTPEYVPCANHHKD